jgi:hypothetical protein
MSARLEADATFCAETEGVRPQTLEIRAWAEDFRPERERVYSPSVVLHVLTPDEHAAWMTGQLRRWASLSEDVYEEELRLHDVNRQLRTLSAEELQRGENQQQLQQQAAAERANGQRLQMVTRQGELLIRRAVQNPEMQAVHLEMWAQSLQQLQKIADSRMPTVAELLSASGSQALAETAPGPVPDATATQAAPFAGNDRGQVPPNDSKAQPGPENKGEESSVPAVVDVESGFHSNDNEPADSAPAEEQSGSGRLSLPSTTLQGGAAPAAGAKDATDTAEQMIDAAVEEQRELLAQFQKVRDDLQSILDDLQNSTFVKRLKAASRNQLEVAEDLNRTLDGAFGIDEGTLADEQRAQHSHIASRSQLMSEKVADIESDLQAYFDRTQEARFGRILEEMSESRVVEQLLEVGESARRNRTGEAIARAEYWCDTLDRWAEELVIPSKSSSSGGGKKASLPPAIVLEVMRILKSEIDLREETRGVEQARAGITEREWRQQAVALSHSQEGIQQRVNDVITDILALPEGSDNFGDEVELLGLASEIMYEATGILASPETGPTAIAAQTEAIEILLRSKRSNPSGSGGGGSSPGGGSQGTTEITALSLFGPASDPNAVIEYRGVSHASAVQSEDLPEEFREGLDKFFDALDQRNTSERRVPVVNPLD